MPEEKLIARIREMSPEEKEMLIKKIGQDAHDNEAEYWGCAQSTLAALQEHLGLEDGAVFKSSTALAGGTGRTGRGVCGALAAGVMAISAIFGRDKLEPVEESIGYQEAMRLSGILCDKFEEEFTGLTCHDVQRKVFGRIWNLRDDKERQGFIEGGLHDTCAEVCQKAGEMAAAIILKLVEKV